MSADDTAAPAEVAGYLVARFRRHGTDPAHYTEDEWAAIYPLTKRNVTLRDTIVGPEWECEAGQKDAPVGCQRHRDHHWCSTCEGYYGVPHTGLHEGPNKHPYSVGFGVGECACRVCKIASGREQAPAGDPRVANSRPTAAKLDDIQALFKRDALTLADAISEVQKLIDVTGAGARDLMEHEARPSLRYSIPELGAR